MAGTFTSQNKILPGVYLNFYTNEPLSIQLNDRGTVLLLQEMSVGVKGNIYTVTASASDLPEQATKEDKKLVTEALKLAKTVKIYSLGAETHTAKDVETALLALKTEIFDTLCYPYDKEESGSIKTAIATWVKVMNEEEGVGIQAVLANHKADSEYVINVTQGVALEDLILTPDQTTAWVAGATAGAGIRTSNTNQKYAGAIDVSPRKTKTEMEQAVKNGEFIFKVDTAQNVTAVYDVNSLTTYTPEKSKKFSKNRVIRTLSSIRNDIRIIFESNYLGKYNNDADGRSLLRAALIAYMKELNQLGAIQNFTAEDVHIEAGTEADAVVIHMNIQPVDSVEKIYITIQL